MQPPFPHHPNHLQGAGLPGGAGVRVCPGCGVIAPLGRTACSVCSAPFAAAPIIAAGRLGPALFACIHGCDFACSACGKRSPLATIDIDGEVECLCCGLRQVFDAAQWKEALGHAHDVADLAGPSSEGQNPVPGRPIGGQSRHAQIGVEYTSSTKTQSAMIMDAQGKRTHSLRTTVSPGHPLCTLCHVPLEVSIDQPGTTRTRCPRCSDVATYALPPGAASFYGALRGVIGAEQRTDKPVARVVRGAGGGESVACPQCGAALAAGEGEIVRCTFCNTLARVPGKLARRQRQGEPPPVRPFWVLLDGLSPGRKKLLKGRSEDEDDDDDDDGDDGHAGAAVIAPLMHAPYGHASPHLGAPAWAHPNLHRSPQKKSVAGLVIGIVIALVLLAVGVVVAAAVYLELGEAGPAKPATTQPATQPAQKRRR